MNERKTNITNSNSEDSYASDVSRRNFLRTGSAALAITALLGVKANALDEEAVKDNNRTNFAPSVSPKAVKYSALTVDGLNIAYREAAAWGGLRNALWKNRTPENEAAVASLLEFDTVKAVYLTGSKLPELISPDNWNSDFYTTVQRPNGRRIQLDLFYDYRTNVDLYPKWQAFLKERQPNTIIFWGQGDIFFTPEGGEAYLADLPKAEMHRLDAGHFAVEDCLDYISSNIHRYYHDVVGRKG